MIELGNRAGFAVEPFAELRIRCECGRKNLDRDGAIEARVAGFVDLAHSAAAKERQDLGRVWVFRAPCVLYG
jgi:hypothetical protein